MDSQHSHQRNSSVNQDVNALTGLLGSAPKLVSLYREQIALTGEVLNEQIKLKLVSLGLIAGLSLFLLTVALSSWVGLNVLYCYYLIQIGYPAWAITASTISIQVLAVALAIRSIVRLGKEVSVKDLTDTLVNSKRTSSGEY